MATQTVIMLLDFCDLDIIFKSGGSYNSMKWVGGHIRVPTSSGNHEKPEKSLKKVPCMEKSWN